MLREYSYCCIANQLCVTIMVTISGQYDIIDVVSIQRFVIEEFKQRHLEVKEIAKAKQLREEAMNADSSSE